jgi:hypothetical protein
LIRSTITSEKDFDAMVTEEKSQIELNDKVEYGLMPNDKFWKILEIICYYNGSSRSFPMK